MRWSVVLVVLALLCCACGDDDSEKGRKQSQVDGKGGNGGSDETGWLQLDSDLVVPLHGHVEARFTLDRAITGDGDVHLDLRAPLPPGIRVGASATDDEPLSELTIPKDQNEARLFFFAGREVEALGEAKWEVSARSDRWSGKAEVQFEVGALVTNAQDAGDGSLRDLVESAPRLQSMPTIGFAPWVFTEETTIALESPLLLTASLTIKGMPGPTGPLITLDGQGRTRIMQAGMPGDATPRTITIDGLKFTRGLADDDGLCMRSFANVRLEYVIFSACRADELGTVGGALYAAPGSRTVVFNARFESNAATEGGALYLDGWAQISGSTFAQNEALGGGAILVGENAGTVSINVVDFEKNDAAAEGGAILVLGPSSLEVTRGTFIQNSAANAGGGAIAAEANGDGEGAELRVEDSTFRGNHAGNGGAIRGNLSTVAIVRSGFEENEALPQGAIDPRDPPKPEDHRGGALFWDGPATIEDSLFRGNLAGRGGAIHARGNFIMHRCSVIENKAEEWAGGLDLVGIVEGQLRHTTIAANEALLGGGLYIHLRSKISLFFDTIVRNRATGIGDEDGSTSRPGPVGGLALANAELGLLTTVIAGNESTGDTARDLWVEPDQIGSPNVATLISHHRNFIGDRKGGGKAETELLFPSDVNLVGDTRDGSDPLDPMLGELVRHDDLTWIAFPMEGSPLIDTLPAADVFCERADQRGVPRPQGVACDTGAVEVE